MLCSVLRKSRMALPAPTSPRHSLPRSFCKDSKEYAKRYYLDENQICVEDSHWKHLPQNIRAKTLITCEHASNRFPQNYKKEMDLENTHWASDIGAEDVAAALASNMKLPLIASRVSRLVIDVNRPLTSDTLFRLSAEGKPIALNSHLSPEDKQERIDQYWKPYRHDLAATLLDIPAIDLVLSIHSFTPLYEGESRECEIGVLFTDSKKEGQFFMKELLAKGYKTVENEPWPAAICDVLNPITAAGRQCVILEIRNDLASNATFRKRLADDIQGILETLELA